MNNLRVEKYTWLAAPLGGENPQAIFREPNADMKAVAHATLPEDKRHGLGQFCGRRVLPYRMQDRYGRQRQPRDFVGIVLENEFLKATFLPELGGRLMSLIYKPTQRELLFNNPAFQPANLALRDAWFAGGIEWNCGQFGHAFSTCAPVFAAAIPGGLRLYDYERCTGLFWQIDFYLPAGAEFLYAFTRVLNPREAASSMYWWTNTAVPESADVRVLAPASKAIYCDLSSYFSNGQLAYGQMDLPGLPSAGGVDATYAVNAPFANEFYYQCDQAEMPWEAALDGKGTGFVEASTYPLNTRKLFCWGMHQGGRHWQEFLSVPGQAYLEIQAGIAPTQLHGMSIPGRNEMSWMQAFGYVEADPVKVHGADWTAAWQTVDVALKQKLSLSSLNRIQETCRQQADAAPLEVLHAGSGWGALELKRRAHSKVCHSERSEEPRNQFDSEVCGESRLVGLGFRCAQDDKLDAFIFPDSTLGPEQQQWLALLETGRLPEREQPGEWMIQKEWRELLEKTTDRHWFALLHLGVMRVESFDDAGAQAAWNESIRLRPSAWAYRNLGALEVRRNQPGKALEYYRQAWELAGKSPDISFAQEYLAALHAAKETEAAWKFYQSLPAETQGLDCIKILAAKIAFARNDLAFVESALAHEYASLREGARDLTDLWVGVQEKRGTNVPPPARIDFRVIE